MAEPKREFLNAAFECGAMRYGIFQLKSGEPSPIFFDTGRVCLATHREKMGRFLAEAFYSQLQRQGGKAVLLGIPYKGILIVADLAAWILRRYQEDFSVAYLRKEAKTHGEGGLLVGAPLGGQEIVLVDDVLSRGTALRRAIPFVLENGGMLTGVFVVLDRQMRAEGSDVSYREQLEQEYNIRVVSALTLADILEFAAERISPKDFRILADYFGGHCIAR